MNTEEDYMLKNSVKELAAILYEIYDFYCSVVKGQDQMLTRNKLIIHYLYGTIQLILLAL